MSVYKFAPNASQSRSIHPFVTWENGFTDDELNKIIEIGESLQLNKATVGGYSVEDDYEDKRISNVSWLSYNDDTTFIYDKLGWIARNLNGQFYDFDLFGFVEDFQFTVYDSEEQGHYGFHIDQSADNGMSPRKLSLVLQLSDPKEYTGGDLQLMTSSEALSVKKEKGLVTAFPSYMLHRVTPVTSGVRKSLVCWISGPAFR